MAFTFLAKDKHQNPIQALKPGTNQSVAYTGTAGTIANALDTKCVVVRVIVTSDAYVKIGTDPTATTSDMYMAANVPEYFRVDGTATIKVSAVQVSTGGTLFVTEMN